MCISTLKKRLLDQQAELQVKLAKVDAVENSVESAVKAVEELLQDCADALPDELPEVWQGILAIGQKYNLTVQPIAADELRQWEAAQAENQKLKAELETERATRLVVESDFENYKELWYGQLQIIQGQLRTEHAARLALEETLHEVRSPLPENYRQEVQIKRSTHAPNIDEEEVLIGKEYDAAVEEELALDDDVEKYLNPTPETEKEARVTGFLQTGDTFSGAPPEISHTIPALTVFQPRATLIAQGHKKIETRNKRTNYRGPLAIHAGMRPADWSTLIEDEYAIPEGKEWPLGAVVAICDLVDCVEMTPEFITAQTQQERALGIWEPGRFAWLLDNVQPIYPPVLVKGKQGLWRWDGMAAIAIEPEKSQDFDGCFEKWDSKFKSSDKQWDVSVKYKNDGGLALLFQGEKEGFTETITKKEWEGAKAAHKEWTKRGVLGDYSEELLQRRLQQGVGVPIAEPVEPKAVPEETTELQQLLLNNSDFTFEELGVSVTIRSVIAPADDIVDFESEEVQFTVTNSTGKTREYFEDASTFLFSRKNNVEQAALGYANYFLSELEKEAKIKEKIGRWNADKVQESTEPLEALPSFELVSSFTVGDRLQWNDSEDIENKSRSQGLIGIITRMTKLGDIAWTPEGSTIERLLPLATAQRVLTPIAETTNQETAEPETETRFKVQEYSVQVYPQLPTGTTFRFLDAEGTVKFANSLTTSELADRPYKEIAEQLIQAYEEKEKAKRDRIANPYKKPEDDFIELVKLNPSVGYLKQKIGADAGKILATYIAFANKNSKGERAATKSKRRAGLWRDYFHASFQSSGWEVGEVRKVDRMKGNEPGKPEPLYEIKIIGASIEQIQKLAEQDFSLLPNELAPQPTEPHFAASPTHTIKVNGHWLASGSEQEMRSRFEEELHLLGVACTSVSLLEGEKILEKFAVTDFVFKKINFDLENPEFEATHLPTEKKFTVWKKPLPGQEVASWRNSVYPYDNSCPNREGAAADAVRRSLRAQQAAD